MQWTYQGKIVEELPEDCEAFVYLITNTTNDRKYVGKKLAKFKIPSEIVYRSELPRNATGKVLKRALKN